MSHTMNIKTEVKDMDILKKACEKLGLRFEVRDNPRVSKFALYQNSVNGTGVFLPDWQYPVVFDDQGGCHFDNYGGRWGDMKELTKLQAHYGIEKAKVEAYRQGYWCTESYDETTQELVLQINVGE